MQNQNSSLIESQSFFENARDYAAYFIEKLYGSGDHGGTVAHRQRSTFKTNKSAAIALPEYSFLGDHAKKNNSSLAMSYPVLKEMKRLHQKQIAAETDDEVSTIILKKVELVAGLIREHAARRVDLFFYLLIAVYGTNYNIEKTTTIKQNGVGHNNLGTQAAHASLFPHIKLTQKSSWRFFLKPPILFENTYFDDALNMTVELPQIVNVFDGMLEGKKTPSTYVHDLTKVLNQVSMKEKTPAEGMYLFFKIMSQFFNDFEQQQFSGCELKHQLALQKVCEYEKNGTFLFKANPDLTIQSTYFLSLLRVFTKDTELAGRKNFLESRYSLLREEILAGAPVMKRKKS